MCTRFMHSTVASAHSAHVPVPALRSGRQAHQRSHSCARSLASPGASPAFSIALPRATSPHFPPSPLSRLLRQTPPNSPAILDWSALKLKLPVCARRRRISIDSAVSPRARHHTPSPSPPDSPVNHHHSFLLLRFLQLFSPLSNIASRPPLDDCAFTP